MPTPSSQDAVPAVPQKVSGRRIGWLTGGLVGAAALAMVLFITFRPSLDPVSIGQPATVIAATPTSAIALAVLPLTNLSSDPEQEFFSDGLTEEITSALAKVPDLSVVARTSAFEFKGQNRNIRTIGEQLGATHLIEGSVRRAGDRVRVTVQLIGADDGTLVWSDDYDRELTDIFAIQDDIAQAVAAALRVPLGLEPGSTLLANRTDDVHSYEQFLRARALKRGGRPEQAAEILESLVANNPRFTPAWGLLAHVYIAMDAWEKAETVARQAIRWDPGNAAAQAALAGIESRSGRWTAGDDGFRRALEQDPYEPEIMDRYRTRLGVSGRIKEALLLGDKLRALEPLVPSYNVNHARFLVTAGQTQAAIEILQKVAPEYRDINRNITLARAHAAEGRYAEAADTLLREQPTAFYSRRSVYDAARLLRSAPQKAGSPQTLPALEQRLNFVYAHVGALDRILDDPERNFASHEPFDASLDALWLSETAPLRKTERFRNFVRDSGLVEYWRERGWPEFCRPLGVDDFVCE